LAQSRGGVRTVKKLFVYIFLDAGAKRGKLEAAERNGAGAKPGARAMATRCARKNDMKTTKITPRALRAVRHLAATLAASGDVDPVDLKAVVLTLTQCADPQSDRLATALEKFQSGVAKTCLARLDALPRKRLSPSEWLEWAPIEEIERVLFGPPPAELSRTTESPPAL
jgi:hypothetical protein